VCRFSQHKTPPPRPRAITHKPSAIPVERIAKRMRSGGRRAALLCPRLGHPRRTGHCRAMRGKRVCSVCDRPGVLSELWSLRAGAACLIVSVMRASIRAYEPSDLSSILRLWEESGSVPVGSDGLTLDQAVELISSGIASTLVAERDGAVVGIAVGSVAAAVGWIYRLSVATDEDD